MNKLSHRLQRTIARAAEVRGVGYLTGADVRLRFLPAPPCTGVVFVRTDLQPPVHIPARIDQVTGSQRRTTLGQPPRCVGLVEHALAALAGLRIDNCLVEVDAPEPPGLDGSAAPFVQALCTAGIDMQSARRAIWTVERSVVVSRGGATLALHPHAEPGLRITYFLDYGDDSPVVRQTRTQVITPGLFASELARCRTFLLESEAQELQRQGIGKRTRITDLLVFSRHGPLDNKLRYADEPARHKILDIVGDLALLGQDVWGQLIAYRSGHSLNAELVRILARCFQGTRGLSRLAA